MTRKFVSVFAALGLMLSMMVVLTGGAGATHNFGHCVSGGGTVSGQGQNQVCTITTTTTDTTDNPAGQSEQNFEVDSTTTSTTTITPGGTANTTTSTETTECRSPGGQPVGDGALEHNPNCQA